MIIINLYFNVLILTTITYILKVQTTRSQIILGAVIGAYRIFFPYFLFDILMIYVTFKNLKYLSNFIIIVLILKALNYNPFISLLAMYLLTSFKNKENIIYYYTTIYISGTVIKLKGLMDTGNSLEYLNIPVLIISKKQIPKNVELKKPIYIPYQTITEKGILKGFIPDKVVINNKTIKKVIIAVTEENVELILNPKIMEEK
ncbi:MAG: sigma-E processing peptidase SpoIIGA [Bacilli bacterium]